MITTTIRWLHIPPYIPWDWFLLTDVHTQYHNHGSGSLRRTGTVRNHSGLNIYIYHKIISIFRIDMLLNINQKCVY